ncbi:MAG: T9SS type A sorting domain-containing protein [Flavobacteriaceae bacterium]|nr:T9SS type A sorting domain-containing protein [Flavobacteriaceae bacterium]
MKQIYVIAFFLLPFPGFSQLYIKPYGDQDSYVYVEGQFIYVEKGIDLTINPSGMTNAGIYLRDEAQLLQGNSNSANTGNGLISVFQEGDATAYTYNYWSSPVQNNSNSLLFGNILFEPVDKTNSNKAKITSELNGNANPLTISNRWIYKFSGADYSDWVYIGNTFDINPGEGFTMKGVSGTNMNVVLYGISNNPGNQQRYDFRGRPNTGNITLEINEDESRLVGNPYPSALDLNAFLLENKSITGIAYFWDSSPVTSHYLNEYEGGYGAYSPAAGNNGYVPAVFSKYDGNGNPINHNHETGNYYARRYSPIGQGFLVVGNEKGSLTFRNEYRKIEKENSSTSEFKAKLIPLKISDTENVALLRLNVEFNNKYIRQLLLIHSEIATSGIDRAMDAQNLSLLESDSGWLLENESYLINVLPFDLYEKIPLYLRLSEKTELNFKIAALENFNSEVFLFDSETGLYYDLKNQDYKIQLNEGEYHKRFKIAYTNPDLISAKEEIEEMVKPLKNYAIFQNNPLTRLEITTPTQNTSTSIALFDGTGRKIFEFKNVANQNYFEFPTSNLSNGIHIVKITGPTGTIISKKVIISN